jgi:8-oxo-dGTP diphosphatase
MTEADLILAAGAVVVRKGPEVLLVHRPKYDDWSFPKGKLDPGEHTTTAAVREVAEETGLDVRLGPPLSMQEYDVRNGSTRHKQVHYWVARVVGDDDVSSFRFNAEIDGLAWVPVAEAARLLSYRRDRETLAEAAGLRKRSHPLIVLRHGKAAPRKTWTGDDRLRPLHPDGELQAEQVVPVLAAYGVQRVISSTSTRCRDTVGPYADVLGVDVETSPELSEEAVEPGAVEELVHALMAAGEPAVICTHRPVLPHLYAALGVPDPKLDAGAMLVVHHRRGRVLATELHCA